MSITNSVTQEMIGVMVQMAVFSRSNGILIALEGIMTVDRIIGARITWLFELFYNLFHLMGIYMV